MIPVVTGGSPSEPITTATGTGTTGAATGTLVKTLLERKRLALGRSVSHPSAVDSSEEEIGEGGRNSARDGGGVRMNKPTAGTASFNVGERTSFTVEDSDALETQSWAGRQPTLTQP